MLRKFNIFYNRKFKRFFRHKFSKIVELNEKYAKPQIEMTKTVKTTLFMLMFYLVFLVGLLIYKFIATVR